PMTRAGQERAQSDGGPGRCARRIAGRRRGEEGSEQRAAPYARRGRKFVLGVAGGTGPDWLRPFTNLHRGACLGPKGAYGRGRRAITLALVLGRAEAAQALAAPARAERIARTAMRA